MSKGNNPRAFTGVLYPDTTSYVCSEKLEILAECFDKWGYILHNKDVDENGELKKPHYHWVGYKKNGVDINTLAKKLDIPANMIEKAKHGWRAIVRYMVHLDDSEKAQYDRTEICCNFDYFPLMKDEAGSDGMATGILNYLCESGCYSMRQLVSWSLNNGCWGELRRGSSIWNAIMLENRDEFMRSKEHGF